MRCGAALACAAVVMALPVPGPWNSRFVMAYAVGITVLYVLNLHMLARPRRQEMQAVVRHEGTPTWGPLAAAGVLSLISLAALAYLLRTVAHQPAGVKALHLVVSVYDVLITWTALHTMFARRYAALYYAPVPGQPEQAAGGLLFPDADLTPDYWDFLYYSFTIGMCYQTSDVCLNSPEMRRYTLVHCVISYLYGVGILSLLVSAVGGAFG